MKQQKLTIQQTFDAPVEQVFAKLSDHNQLSSVLGIPVKRIKNGVEKPNGVGSVRRMGPWPFGTQEEVVTVQPNKHIEYRISKFGGPVVNHTGNIYFKSIGKSTEVKWEIEFDATPRFVGSSIKTLLKVGLAKGLSKTAKKMHA